MVKYKFLEHTADIKFQAFGKTIEECFKNSLLALKETISNKNIKPVIDKNLVVTGKDYEGLLYNFLEEFLFLIDSKNLIISEIKELKIVKKKALKKIYFIGKFDSIKNYKTITDVKAITYNEMFVKKQKNKYISQVVLDV